jgi:hypothetical protein
MTKFAGLLNTYIHQAGVPLRRVASQSGIPHQTIFNWLNGTRPRWHPALLRDLQRLGTSLGLAEDEITLLLRLAGCIPGRSGLDDIQEASMENTFRIPAGWFAMGDAPDKYDMGVDPAIRYENRPCVTIRAHPDPTDFGGLAQSFKADYYHGKRLRYSAAVRSVDLENRAALFMRVAGANDNLLAFDNMLHRQITGTSDWTHHSIVLDVAEEAEEIMVGFFLSLKGQIWIGDVRLEVVGKDVPTTDVQAEIVQYFPANLGFED